MFNFSPVHYIRTLDKNERMEYAGETRFYGRSKGRQTIQIQGRIEGRQETL